ncbi:hypothetical protein [Rhabdochromatium marinum]|uniref:hypothetical protein n=1 Tax=Rhabdochromatium marinum TaxID=48729 RepID=UPI001905DC15|nr:hypothetical protein [Rhabdochromatium marinum]
MNKAKIMLLAIMAPAVLAAGIVALAPRLDVIFGTDEAGDDYSAPWTGSYTAWGGSSPGLASRSFGQAECVSQIHFATLGSLPWLTPRFDMLDMLGNNRGQQQSIFRFAAESGGDPKRAAEFISRNGSLGMAGNGRQQGFLDGGPLLRASFFEHGNSSSVGATGQGAQSSFVYASERDQATNSDVSGAGTTTDTQNPRTSPVPIPAAFGLFGGALVLLVGLGRRCQSKRHVLNGHVLDSATGVHGSSGNNQ